MRQPNTRTSEQPYRGLIEAAVDHIFTVRVDDGRAVETLHGSNCEVVTGYTPAEFIADERLWISVVPPEERGLVEQHLQRLLAGEQPPPIEHRIRRKDGQIRWVLRAVYPQQDNRGRLVAYDGLLRDITEQKAGELALRRLNRDLEQLIEARTADLRQRTEQLAQKAADLERREREFRTLANNVPALFSYVGADLRYGYVNRVYEETFQRSAGDIVNQAVAEVMGPQQFEIARPHIEAALRGEEVVYDGEFDFPDGRHLMHVCYVPDRDEQGTVHGFFALVTDVTELKQAEKQAQLLAEAVSHLGEGVLITNSHLDWPEPDVVFVNQAICRITGYSADELIGQTPRILQGDQTDRETLDRIKSELSAGRSVVAELTNYHKDGTPYDAELFITPLFNAKGRRTNFVSIHRDITERKRAERERARLATVVQSSQDAVFSVSLEGIIETWNRGAELLYGYSPDEAIGQPIFMIEVPGSPWGWREILARIQRGEPLTVSETSQQRKDRSRVEVAQRVAPVLFTQRQRKDRSQVHVALSVGPLSDARGRVMGVSAIVRDITEQKRTESELREREERLQAVLNTASDAIITINPRGTITDVNPATERMFGYTQQELIGQNVKIVMPPPFCDEHDGYLARYLETGKARIIGIGREVVAKHRDGSTFPVDLAVSKVEQLGLFTGIVRDISERVDAQEKLLRSERLAAIGEAMTGLAHESRNALQRSQVCLDLLAEQLEGRSDAMELLTTIQLAQDELYRLYEEVRVYAAPIHLRLQYCEVGEIVRKAWEEVAAERQGRDASLEECFAGDDFHCCVDPFAMSQVFRNILENALHACGDPVRITVDYADAEHEGDSALSIAIRDNGPGVASEHAEQIFHSFFTTKTKGTGLGMAIAERIVQAHQGRIDLAADGQQGAEFIVTLPRIQK